MLHFITLKIWTLILLSVLRSRKHLQNPGYSDWLRYHGDRDMFLCVLLQQNPEVEGCGLLVHGHHEIKRG